MRTIRRLALVTLPLWLAACAVPTPVQRVAVAVPGQWSAPLPHRGSVADLSAWWEQFNDPLLVQLIESAQAVSPTVASARSRIEQARATRTAARAALSPTVDGQASVSRGTTQQPLALSTTLQAGLQAGWEIDLFGGHARALQAAQARFESAQAGWHDARVAVAAETAASYVRLRTCERELAVVANDARSRAETARLSQLTVQAGFTAPATGALARASAAQPSVSETQQRSQCDIEVNALVAVSAIPEPQLRQQMQAPWQDPGELPALPLLALPAQVLEQRPDIGQARDEVAAASADIGTAQAQLYPRVSLSGSIAAGVVRTGGATSEGTTWSIGPLAVSLPLLDGGRRRASVDAARARYDEALALYAARVRQAVREVEVALVNLESARLRMEDAGTAYAGYRSFFVATEARYRNGLGSLVELEDARRTALAAETSLVTLQGDRLAAWIALYRAAGGGWSRPAAPPA
ncbi:MAG: efflux transporter outer membrane subunit [Ramlibacter sp.]